ncbi:Condensin complex subunit 2 [Anthophora plagiata]
MAACTSPSTSSSSISALLRKSLHIQSSLSPTLLENNDEAERLARRREINAINTSEESVNTKNRRQSLGLSFLAQMSAPDIKDKITECVKLSTENKINIKNAFSLQIIDFMTYMIKKQDANMTNLQIASTSLDVSTKIYGFRVDGIYTQIIKMAGGADKEKDESPTEDMEQDLNNKGIQINNLAEQNNKRKSKGKVKIFSTVDNLRGIVETAKPSLWIMENEDTQTTDGLYQAMLSNHAFSKFYLHMYNDIIVDTIERKTDSTIAKNVSIPKINDFSEAEICPLLANFEFQGWINDNEEEKEEDKDRVSEETNENRFQFDLDASVPSEDEVIHDDIDYLDIQDEEQNVNRCAEAQRPVQKIVDLCKVVSNSDVSKTSEYYFLQKSNSLHWAGPSHWKISHLSNFFREKKIIETCQRKPDRKKKEIELCYDDDTRENVMANFLPGKASKFEAKNIEWCEEVNTLPRDMHYNIANASKLYLYKLIDVYAEKKNELNATHISDIDNYDYNNENDLLDYCPNVSNQDYETREYSNENECNNEPENDEIYPQTFTGENLVNIPKLTNKIAIAYNIRVKRIDMKQLKKSIWKCLTLNNVDENTNTEKTEKQEAENKIKENKSFNEIYKILPNMLSKTNKEALSFPISFVSLLHIANEKTLKIQSVPDLSDLIIEAN